MGGRRVGSCVLLSQRLGPSWRGDWGLQGFPLGPRGSCQWREGLQEGWRGKCGALFSLISRAEQFCLQVAA